MTDGLSVARDGAAATIARRFAASPGRLWDAHMAPDLLRQWCVGPDGWEMTECVNEARAGGRIRYAWKKAGSDEGFHLTGRILELARPDLIVHVERMHLPDPAPECRVETRFAKDGEGALVTMTMEAESSGIMDGMLGSGMADGMEQSYRRLDGLLARNPG